MSINNFASIQVRLASPETILKWSHGEVTKPETLTIVHKKLNVMVYSANAFSVQLRTGNVLVVNIKSTF